MSGPLRVAAFSAALALLGCASRRNLVIVVPDRQGHVGGVVVDDGRRQIVLETAGAAARMGEGSGAVRAQVAAEEADRLFAAALAAAPRPTSRFSLYFDEGTERLTPESESRLPAILEDIRSRGSAEIEVIGHTDRVGDDESNLALSRRRADFVRDWLAGAVPLSRIDSVGRGEVDPAVATADGQEEPRNRRVEVTVR